MQNLLWIGPETVSVLYGAFVCGYRYMVLKCANIIIWCSFAQLLLYGARVHGWCSLCTVRVLTL